MTTPNPTQDKLPTLAADWTATALRDLRAQASRAATSTARALPVTDEQVMRAAAAMAAQGYEFEPATLDALRAYLQGFPILLRGAVGSGKTLFFRLLRTLAPDGGDYRDLRKIEIVSMLQLAVMPANDVRAKLDGLAGREIMLDDIGAETVNNTFGVVSEIIQLVLDIRTHAIHRTHLTTNLDYRTLETRYGGRVADRIKTCKAFVLAGSSHRRAAPNRWLIDTAARRGVPNRVDAAATINADLKGWRD